MEVPVPGGHLLVDESVVAFHLPPWPPPAHDVFQGYLMVTSRRHVPDMAGLTEDEAAAVGVAVSRLSRALKDLGAQRVYLAVIGDGVPHLHVHLVPRWPGTPAEVPWTEVDQWEGARRGSFEQAAELTGRLRARLGGEREG
ncbi:MAG: histidine triad family protein [Nocardioidaceae bacterium]|nr:histidine triad family protein [Nocardioidaceae bacterium]